MANRWNHSICDFCWEIRCLRLDEVGRIPIRFAEVVRVDEPCCYCGETHRSGIYVRDDPQDMRCLGDHSQHGPRVLETD